MKTEKLFVEMEALNVENLPVRGAFLDIYKDLVALREVSLPVYDRSVQLFEKEYEEVFEIRKRQEEIREEITGLRQSEPTPESTLESIPEVALTRKKKELQVLLLEESRLVGNITEFKIAPEYLRLFGFSNLRLIREPMTLTIILLSEMDSSISLT